MMNGSLDFLLNATVWYALFVVVVAILLDAVLGIIKTFKPDEENFDFKKLPQFVSNSIFPYVGGLVALAVVAEFVGQPYDAIFYPVAVAVGLKYVNEIYEKAKTLFGVGI